MAGFLLKWKLRGRPNRNRADETIKRSRIVAGSRPLADVYVADRMVAQEALALSYDGHRLQIEVLGELSGVFVDGHPVKGTGPVSNGSTVQFGSAAIEVEIDSEMRLCTLTVNEAYMPAMIDGIVKKAKPETPFSLEPDGPQEHKWGKSKLLTRANLAAIALGALACASFALTYDSEVMTRGELANWHQVGAHTDELGDRSVESCSDCHDPFNSNYAPVCAKCHPGFESTATHPFEQADEFSCAHCHMDHRGGTYDLMPPMDIVEGVGEPVLCADCHDHHWPQLKELDDSQLKLVMKKSRDEPGAPTERVLEVDGFSHADHRIQTDGAMTFAGPDTRGQVPLACADCHKELGKDTLVNPSQKSSNDFAEFGLVTYEQCLECHADWRIDVPHGRDDNGSYCYRCHDQVSDPWEIQADIRSTEIPVTEMKYVLKPRQHDFRSDECLQCHVLEKQDVGQKTSIAEHVFRHDHHLSTVDPATGTELALSESCKTCHQSMAASEQMSGTPLIDMTWEPYGKTTGCVSCHTEGDPEVVAVSTGATRKVVDMYHSVHTLDAQQVAGGATRSRSSRDTLATGCMACHTPKAGVTRMDFVPKTEDCSACHTGHENIGEGKCVLCHVDRTPGVNKVLNGKLEFRYQEAGIFNREKATKKTTAAIERFDHFSRGHVGHECSECHANEEGEIDKTDRVFDVPWPKFDDMSCVRCHLRERYHW